MLKNNLFSFFNAAIQFFFLGILLLIAGHKWISVSTHSQIYLTVKEIPKNKVGLLLGTSKHTIKGSINLYYRYRIEAASELYHANKINYILVSGDNSTHNYNEPKKIKEDLIKNGIPADKIVLDYAGFRTLDSVVRAQKVFIENEFTVISQQFHNERALFLANYFNCNAIAYNAKSVSVSYGFKVQIREYFARAKVYLDLFFNVKPKFLGKPINIGK